MNIRKFPRTEILPTLLLLVLAVAFIVSAAGKFAGIDSFSWTLLDAGVPGDRLSAILARLLVGLEAACGLLLLFRIRVGRLALPLTAALLVFFSGYLIYLLLVQGNKGDCGCFGDWLPMKPLPALIKNLGLLLVVWLLYRFKGWREWKWPAWSSYGLVLLLTITPLIVLPVSTKKEPLETALLQDRSIMLGKRKEVVAFLSLGCPHCRTAAKKFAGFIRENPALPLVMILNGDAEASEEFLRDTGSEKVPHLHETNPEVFMRLAGKYVPSIYFLTNGQIERRVSYNTLTREAIERWAAHP